MKEKLSQYQDDLDSGIHVVAAGNDKPIMEFLNVEEYHH
jgi:hypothetical protein